MVDTRWLERRGLTWFAVKAVPRKLWARVGKRRFVASLGTHDLHVARARRHAKLAEFEALMAKALSTDRPDPLIEAGMEWLEFSKRIDRGDPSAIAAAWVGTPIDPWNAPPTTDRAVIAREAFDLALHEEIDRMRFLEGRPEDAAILASVAQGYSTPLLFYQDAWLAEGGRRGQVNARTVSQYRRDLGDFAKWMRAVGLPETIEAVTAQVAGRYSGHFVAAGTNRTTANRKMVGPSGYWTWLIKRAHCEKNPWRGQTLPNVRRPGEPKPKRPFTTDEMIRLLNGRPDVELADVIRIGALTALRIEEIYRLTVADCEAGWFNVGGRKTHAGERRVPIHPDLVGIIQRRTDGKAPTGYLIHEPGGPPKPGRDRGMAASKRFGYYRKRQGVHEVLPGSQQSRCDFHSFRRWFITSALNAGIDRQTVAAIAGHEMGNITVDVYAGKPNDERLQACVRAVRLPS